MLHNNKVHNKRLVQVRLVQVVTYGCYLWLLFMFVMSQVLVNRNVSTYVVMCPLISFSFIKWFFIHFA